MSYQRLAEHLTRIAKRLRQREADLGGVALAKSADRLSGSLQRFERNMEIVLRGKDPAVASLEQLLGSPDARALLDAKTLRMVARNAFGRALTLRRDDGPREQRKRLLAAAIKHGKAAEAVVEVRSLLLEARRPTPDLEDRDQVLAEVWRLGSLSKPKLEIEKARLLKDEALLHAMAAAAYIKTTPRSTPRSILNKLVKFSTRVKENVS